MPEETMADFGIYDPNTGWHFLAELAQIYDLRPVRNDKSIVLAHIAARNRRIRFSENGSGDTSSTSPEASATATRT